MIVFTTYNSSEEHFFGECLNSQREYCRERGYKYLEYRDLGINEEVSWRNFRVFQGVNMEKTGEKIVFMKPSLMIMNNEFMLEQIDVAQGAVGITQFKSKFFDSILISRWSVKLQQMLEFCWKFRESGISSRHSYELIETTFPEMLHKFPPRLLYSRWFGGDASGVKIRVDTSVNFPKLYGDYTEIEILNSPEIIYRPGDFCVDMGEEKHEVKINSEKFSELRKRVLDKYNDSKKILRDGTSYRTE
jgi:hypothetical protein